MPSYLNSSNLFTQNPTIGSSSSSNTTKPTALVNLGGESSKIINLNNNIAKPQTSFNQSANNSNINLFLQNK